MKIISGGKYYDKATPYFVKNNIIKIRDIYKLEVAKVMFRLVRCNKSINLSRSFTKVGTIYILEQPDFQMSIVIIIFLIIELQNCKKKL